MTRAAFLGRANERAGREPPKLAGRAGSPARPTRQHDRNSGSTDDAFGVGIGGVVRLKAGLIQVHPIPW